MVEVIKDMLELQDNLCCLMINPEWKQDPPDFTLAIGMEAAEAIDHLGWKWWKKQEPNIEAAKVEVIDMLHFALANEIAAEWQTARKDLSEVADEVAHSYDARNADLALDEWDYEPGDLDATKLFRLIAALAYARRQDIGLILLAGEKLGMSFEEMTTLYRAKVVLNTFRQNNGDKQGKYPRIWGEKEDNDHMQEMMQDVDWSLGTASHRLYALLQARYDDVTADQ
jgi:hypothetical protein